MHISVSSASLGGAGLVDTATRIYVTTYIRILYLPYIYTYVYGSVTLAGAAALGVTLVVSFFLDQTPGQWYMPHTKWVRRGALLAPGSPSQRTRKDRAAPRHAPAACIWGRLRARFGARGACPPRAAAAANGRRSRLGERESSEIAPDSPARRPPLYRAQ